MKSARRQTAAPRLSIVIVDDEKSYAELMAQMIADNLDCAVHAFTRPMEALSGLARITPGVVVTDYSMPQMNGIEFIRRASRIAPHAAFIMISGDDLDPLADELGRLKRLKARLRKPFGWRPLADAIVDAWPAGAPPAFRATTRSAAVASGSHARPISPQS